MPFTFCMHDNLRTSGSIVFKFLLVIHYGHGKGEVMDVSDSLWPW